MQTVQQIVKTELTQMCTGEPRPVFYRWLNYIETGGNCFVAILNEKN